MGTVAGDTEGKQADADRCEHNSSSGLPYRRSDSGHRVKRRKELSSR